MRTQTPTPPLDVVGAEMTRYGPPQHETAVTPTNSLYGPPQHETELEDPEWLISIAAKAFSTEATEPAGSPEVDAEPESTQKEREPTVVRL